MLYPKKYVNKKDNNLLVNLKYTKDIFVDLLKIFSNYNLFILFLEQKLHF